MRPWGGAPSAAWPANPPTTAPRPSPTPPPKKRTHQASDYWHTAYSKGLPTSGPARLIIDLGAPVDIAGLRYTPRQGPDTVTGRIRRYRVYVGDSLVQQM